MPEEEGERLGTRLLFEDQFCSSECHRHGRPVRVAGDGGGHYRTVDDSQALDAMNRQTRVDDPLARRAHPACASAMQARTEVRPDPTENLLVGIVGRVYQEFFANIV